MVFSQVTSLGFGVLGLATGALLWARGHPARRYAVFLWFALMEFIQFTGYGVADQCNNPLNKALAVAAFIHMALQAPVVNWFLLRPDFGVSSREVRRAIVALSAVSACLLVALRLPWPVWLGAPVGLLDGLSQQWPEFFSFAQAGSREVCGTEISCGPEVCLQRTPNHIGWSVPLLPASYFAPTFWSHFCFTFLPGLVLGNTAARFALMVALSAVAVTQLLAAGHMATYLLEWPATFSHLAVPLCLVALGAELYSIKAARNYALAGVDSYVHWYSVNSAKLE